MVKENLYMTQVCERPWNMTFGHFNGVWANTSAANKTYSCFQRCWMNWPKLAKSDRKQQNLFKFDQIGGGGPDIIQSSGV